MPRPTPAASTGSIDRFLDAIWIEEGLAANTLAAYRRDLALLARWLDESAQLPLI
ncbi:MAG: site-specific integrase, partial [Caldimonas sp.]